MDIASKNVSSLQTLTKESFFTLPDTEVLRLVCQEFSSELDRLKRAFLIRSQNSVFPSTQSPSSIRYGTEYDEVNRTLTGVLALRWIYNGQYDTFIGTQPDSIRLSHHSFEWMRTFFVSNITTFEDFYSLLTSVVVNDLDKDPQLASDYCLLTGEDISSLNHDMVLRKAVRAGLVQCLDRLSAKSKTDIISAIDLGSQFNFGQLAHAENAPASLSSLLAMRGEKRVLRLRFMEQLLDIAGAAGHMDWTCAKVLNEPIFEAYHSVYEATTRIITGDVSLREGYDLILVQRADLLRKKGFRALQIKDLDERAFMRVLSMGGVDDLETARLYERVWTLLESSVRLNLVQSLNIDGSVAQPAVQPTYMPALLAQAINVKQHPPESQHAQEWALQSVFHYLSRVMSARERPEGCVVVIERNVLQVLKQVVHSREFRSNPAILESTAIPQSVIVKQAHD